MQELEAHAKRRDGAFTLRSADARSGGPMCVVPSASGSVSTQRDAVARRFTLATNGGSAAAAPHAGSKRAPSIAGAARLPNQSAAVAPQPTSPSALMNFALWAPQPPPPAAAAASPAPAPAVAASTERPHGVPVAAPAPDAGALAAASLVDLALLNANLDSLSALLGHQAARPTTPAAGTVHKRRQCLSRMQTDLCELESDLRYHGITERLLEAGGSVAEAAAEAAVAPASAVAVRSTPAEAAPPAPEEPLTSPAARLCFKTPGKTPRRPLRTITFADGARSTTHPQPRRSAGARRRRAAPRPTAENMAPAAVTPAAAAKSAAKPLASALRSADRGRVRTPHRAGALFGMPHVVFPDLGAVDWGSMLRPLEARPRAPAARNDAALVVT